MKKIAYIMIDFRDWQRRASEKVLQFIAWRMPRKLVMWCAVRLIAHATTGRWGHELTPECKALTALQRWDIEDNSDNGVEP